MKSFRTICFFVLSLSVLHYVQCFSGDSQRDETTKGKNWQLSQDHENSEIAKGKQSSLDESQHISSSQMDELPPRRSDVLRERGYLKVQEGSVVGGLLTIMIIGALGSGGFVAYKFWKNRKQKSSENGQRKHDKLRFIPRVSIPSDGTFSESSNGLNGLFSKKKSGGKQALGSARIFSPSNKNAPTLKLEEEVHHSTAINENIFTNIDNSPRSSEGNSPMSSVRDTPKDINFHIEFSMLEQDSHIKSARDQD